MKREQLIPAFWHMGDMGIYDIKTVQNTVLLVLFFSSMKITASSS